MTESTKSIEFDEEQFSGMEGYGTHTPPIGGVIKASISDFIVREITANQEILTTWDKETPAIEFRTERDRFTTFTLIKKNTDTIAAGKILEAYLDIPQRSISWAGIKDNAAITSQQFSVKGDFVAKLRAFKHKDITITQIHPTAKSIELGCHWGNHFTINIRQLTSPFTSIKDLLDQWRLEIDLSGFPNYYGLQRFGQYRPNSFRVGKYVFQEEYQNAVEEFLFAVYPAEYQNIAEFRNEINKTRDYSAALRHCPNALGYERTVFEQLVKEPTNYMGALFKLPVPLLNLLLSSYQSYIFNKALSMRLNRGDSLAQPLPGDVISILSEARGQPSLVFYKFGGWNDEAILKAFKHERAAIVAPILGHKTQLSNFPYFESIYKGILDEEHFDVSKFAHTNYQLFNYEGTFRPIFTKPTNLDIRQAYVINKYPEIDPNALQLEFSLPKGTYATSLLRELMKKSK